MLAALALLAAGTAATAVAVPADTKKADAYIVDSQISKAPWTQRDLVLTAFPGSTNAHSRSPPLRSPPSPRTTSRLCRTP